MKRLLLAAALCLLPLAGYATTAHQFIPQDAFDCFSSTGGPITCANTFTDTALGQNFHYPIKAMPDGANEPLAQTRLFSFPPSHISSDVKFDCTVQFLTGGSGSQKFGWLCGGSFLPDSTSGGVFWGNLYSTSSTEFPFYGTVNTDAAGYKVSVTSVSSGNEAFRAGNWATSADCTYAQCTGQPGIVAVQRPYSAGGLCPSCTTNNAYFLGLDISWSTGP